MTSRRRSTSTEDGTGRKRQAEFTSTEAKDFVRSLIDRPLIQQFKRRHFPNDGLAYLGLPGEQLLDILSWREFFARWTAVQIVDTSDTIEIADEIERQIMRNRLELNCQLLRANIDDVIREPLEQSRVQWPYHVINLDYFGGLVNSRHDGTDSRIDALRVLFQRQSGFPFLLLMTLNLRGDDGGELERLMQREEDDLRELGLAGVAESFREHRSEGRTGLLKIYVPILVAGLAPRHTLIVHETIRYAGTVPMMHFAFECVPFGDTQANRQLTTTERIALVNRPLRVIETANKERQVEFTQVVRAIGGEVG